MSTRSGRIRPSAIEQSPPKTRKGISPPRSPGRPRKSSPARSPSRKSPSRKSPSRKTSKNVIQKSPSRTSNEIEKAPKSPTKSPPNRSNIDIVLEDIALKIDTRTTRARRTEYSIKDLSSRTNESELSIADKVNGVESILNYKDYTGLRNRKPFEEVLPRRSTRFNYSGNLTDKPSSFSKSESKSVSKSISRSLDTFSDEENLEEEKKLRSKTTTKKLTTPVRETVGKAAKISSRWEFGGRIGAAALAILIPITIFSILISCAKTCTLKALLDISSYKSLSVWFSIPSLLIVTSQLLIQAVISVLPICGKRAERMDDTGKKYCFNALFSSVITIFILFSLDFFNKFNSNFLLNNYMQLALTAYIFGIILSIALFVKSKKLNESKLNPYGNSGFVIYDFCIGREIQPFMKQLDVKIWVSRFTNISTLILAVLIFKHGIHFEIKEKDKVSIENFKELFDKVQLQYTILVFSAMQIIYTLNFIMREYKITTTFFWQSEGMGYLQIISSVLYPFYFTSLSKYIVDSKLVLPTNILIAASVLFLLGFIIMLISNNIKYEFRKNPLHPNLQHLDSMPTFHGKKLLISNLWGKLRHPNYAGDILIHIALAIPGILSKNLIASLPALLTILVLLHRAWRDNARCRRRYGAAWERYCKKVPSVIIPKVL